MLIFFCLMYNIPIDQLIFIKKDKFFFKVDVFLRLTDYFANSAVVTEVSAVNLLGGRHRDIDLIKCPPAFNKQFFVVHRVVIRYRSGFNVFQ